MIEGFKSLVHEAIAEIRLTRPEARNALRAEDKRGIREALRGFEHDRDVRAVVITSGSAGMFCAGTDIKEMARLDRDEAVRMFDEESAMYAALLESSLPIVAAVGGPAMGAGFILACCADIAIASPSARFRMPEVALGVPAPLQTALLPQVVGVARARRMLLLGESYEAQGALKAGLISEVVDDESLTSHAFELAERMAQLPSAGVASQKRLVNAWITGGYTAAVSLSSVIAADALSQDSTRAALNRFVNRASSRRDKPGSETGEGTQRG